MILNKIQIFNNQNHYIIKYNHKQRPNDRLSQLCAFLFYSLISVITFGFYKSINMLRKKAWVGAWNFEADEYTLIEKGTYKVIKGRFLFPNSVKALIYQQECNENIKPEPKPKTIMEEIESLLEVQNTETVEQKEFESESIKDLRNLCASFSLLGGYGSIIASIQSCLEKVAKAKMQEEDECNYVKDFLFDLMTQNENLLKDNEEFALALIKYEPFAIEELSQRLKTNLKIVRHALDMSNKVWMILSPEQKKDIELAKLALEGPYPILNEMPDAFKRDITLVRIALQSDPYNIKYADEALKNDEQLASEVVSDDGLVLEFLSSNLKDNENVVLKAIKENPNAIKFASERLRKDLKIVKAAIENTQGEGVNLSILYVHKELQQNRELKKLYFQKHLIFKAAEDIHENESSIDLLFKNEIF